MEEDICKSYIQQEVNIQNKELTQFNIKKPNNLSKKWEEDFNRHFFLKKRRCLNGQQALAKMLNIRQMQMKTTTRYHLTPARLAFIKKTEKNKCWKHMEKWEPSYAVGGNKTDVGVMENSIAFLKKLKQNYHMIQQFHF